MIFHWHNMPIGMEKYATDNKHLIINILLTLQENPSKR